MTSGRQNLNRGGGGGASGGSSPTPGGDAERRNLRDQPNRRSRRFREAPYRCSLRPPNWPPIQRNRPPPPPTRAHGSRSRQLRGRAGRAWSSYASSHIGNRGLIEVRGGCSSGFREFCLSISVNLQARFFISFGYSTGD